MKEGDREGGTDGRRGAAAIHDLARAAGASSMTVSRVINDHGHVGAATRQKVQTIISPAHRKVELALMQRAPTGRAPSLP